jgi:hypothetical protein
MVIHFVEMRNRDRQRLCCGVDLYLGHAQMIVVGLCRVRSRKHQ